MYSDKVRKLVAELPNAGPLPGATHSAQAENPVCGDVVSLELKVADSTIKDCRYRASGCPAAIAAAAAVSLLCRGMTLQEGLQLEPRQVVGFLDGLPSHKLHGPELAVAALRRALR